MPRRSTIVPHPLTNFMIENLPRARHDDRIILNTAHIDSTRSTGNPVVSPKNSDISVTARSHTSKHDPNHLKNSGLADDISFSFSFLDERRISKRGPHNAKDRKHVALPPKHLLSYLGEPHIGKRSPGEDDNPYYTPPKQDKDFNIDDGYKGRLFMFKDAPRHNRRGL